MKYPGTETTPNVQNRSRSEYISIEMTENPAKTHRSVFLQLEDWIHPI